MDAKHAEMLAQLLSRRQQQEPSTAAPQPHLPSDAQPLQLPPVMAIRSTAVPQTVEEDVVDLTGDDDGPEQMAPTNGNGPTLVGFQPAPYIGNNAAAAPAPQQQPAYRIYPQSVVGGLTQAIGQFLATQPAVEQQQQQPQSTDLRTQLFNTLATQASSYFQNFQQQQLMQQQQQQIIGNGLPPSNNGHTSSRIITSGMNPVLPGMGMNPMQLSQPLGPQQGQQPLPNYGGTSALDTYIPRVMPFALQQQQQPGGEMGGRPTHYQPNNVNAKAGMEAVLAGLQSVGRDDELDPPPGLLAVPLLRHQRLALYWMSKRETGAAMPIGGILADDQGLGKTVTTIALILTNPADRQQYKFGLPAEAAAAAGRGATKRKLEITGPSRNASAKSLAAEAAAAGGSSDEIIDIEDDGDDNNNNDNGPVELGDSSDSDVVEVELTEREKKAALLAPAPSGMAEGGTLVVCPATVLYQWEQEIRSKTSPTSGTTVYIYHGKSKGVIPETLAKFAVILTTYQTLSQEMPESGRPDSRKKNKAAELFQAAVAAKGAANAAAADKEGKKRKREMDKGGPLYRVMWHRIVLDECQVIKNPRTLAAHAAWCLKGRRRWCLSGTPLQNSVDDLYPYFKFLRYEPYNHMSTFKELIRDPINGQNPEIGYKRLQAVLQIIMLRRTKQSKIDGQPVVQLPERRVQLEQKEFTPEEREFYEKLQAEAAEKMQKFQSEGTVRQNYVNILWMLLRLRQACNHPWLVKNSQHGYFRGQLATGEVAAAKRLAADTRATLVNVLQEGLTECVVCNDVPEDPVVSVCGHVYCRQCVSSQVSLAGQGSAEAELAYHCPACGHVLGRHDTYGLGALETASKPAGGASGSNQGNKSGNGMANNWESSAKVDALMQVLDDLRTKGAGTVAQPARAVARSVSGARLAEALAKNKGGGARSRTPPNINRAAPPMEKVIVFSQWTSMLDLVEIPLKKQRYEFRRLDGSMSIPNRQAAIQDFSNCPEVTVMLVSLKAASIGVNLVSANHVVLLDLWYNPTVEEQAIDRAHRIGQTRPVHVTRLTIKDSVEDRILELQDKKRRMVDAAVGEGTEGGQLGTRLTVDDLHFLFGLK